jgi:succinoglycan biosynthesis transport protein ExoP
VLRAVRLALRISADQPTGRGQSLMFASTLPGEGKSTVAALQALFLANAGARTLLVDADVANPVLTELLAPGAEIGLVEVLATEHNRVDSLLWTDPESGLDFLPCRRLTPRSAAPAEDVVATGKINRMIELFKSHYDIIIVDVSPILALADARVIATCIDHAVLLVEWGQVDKRAVMDALRTSPEVAQRLIGCVLNKVDMRHVARYSHYDSGTYKNAA